MAEVAAEFGFNPEVFREYLLRHEPQLAARQGMERRADGRFVKRSSTEKYAKAIEEYAKSADSLRDIAERHGLVYNSLCGYVRRNCLSEQESHRRIVEEKNFTENKRSLCTKKLQINNLEQVKDNSILEGKKLMILPGNEKVTTYYVKNW
ncbi:MAG: hypothetical protein K2K25_12515 [Muribaculaceae bacterium]|nr:hypothetical protein [Muribaculaceae bacterium]